jgi:hypothetical protein
MKWLFLLLLTVNAAIFAWGYQLPLTEQPAVEAGGDVGNMRLVSELAEEQKVEQEAADKSESKPEEEPQVAASETEPEKTAQDKPQEKESEPEEDAVKMCGTIGPVKDHKVAKEVMDNLKQAEIEAKLERKIEKEQIGFWVVIPPMEDGSQAQAKIDELAKVGLEDIWHFRGGGMKNAISLGMFAKKENAENFSKEVLEKGFETEMRPRYLNKANYLVNFTISRSKTVAENMWRDIEQKYSKLPFKKQSCE